ncbi:hypothetical protein CERSUDRAFT_94321 [Gelatoporia subvermispora B]|uniref:Uncharacterized protein n=1 Tax=Ceriporiopsis subvermispora (strain B) TaxID=914234 RepID=M2PLR0_CERS8|nr:hypothetical protein CERSUDRAFT_94321 [Gelatoporia subvermispora B]
MTVGVVSFTEIPNNLVPAPVANAMPTPIAAALPSDIPSTVSSSPVNGIIGDPSTILRGASSNNRNSVNPASGLVPTKHRVGANHALPAQLMHVVRSGPLDPRTFREADYGTSPNMTIALDAIPTGTDADATTVVKRAQASHAHHKGSSSLQRIQMAEYGAAAGLDSSEDDDTPLPTPKWYELKAPAMNLHNPKTAASSMAGTVGMGRFAAGGLVHSAVGGIYGAAPDADAAEADAEDLDDDDDAPGISKRHSLELNTNSILPDIPNPNVDHKKVPAWKENIGLLNIDSNTPPRPPPEDPVAGVADKAQGAVQNADVGTTTAEEDVSAVAPAVAPASTAASRLPVSKDDLKYIQD